MKQPSLDEIKQIYSDNVADVAPGSNEEFFNNGLYSTLLKSYTNNEYNAKVAGIINTYSGDALDAFLLDKGFTRTLGLKSVIIVKAEYIFPNTPTIGAKVINNSIEYTVDSYVQSGVDSSSFIITATATTLGLVSETPFGQAVVIEDNNNVLNAVYYYSISLGANKENDGQLRQRVYRQASALAPQLVEDIFKELYGTNIQIVANTSADKEMKLSGELLINPRNYVVFSETDLTVPQAFDIHQRMASMEVGKLYTTGGVLLPALLPKNFQKTAVSSVVELPITSPAGDTIQEFYYYKQELKAVSVSVSFLENTDVDNNLLDTVESLILQFPLSQENSTTQLLLAYLKDKGVTVIKDAQFVIDDIAVRQIFFDRRYFYKLITVEVV